MTNSEPGCPATDAQRARKPPAAIFTCWDRSRWSHRLAEFVWVLAAIFGLVLVVGVWVL